jgi:hypothetical protein
MLYRVIEKLRNPILKYLIRGCNSVHFDGIHKQISLWLQEPTHVAPYCNLRAPVFQQSECKNVFFTMGCVAIFDQHVLYHIPCLYSPRRRLTCGRFPKLSVLRKASAYAGRHNTERRQTPMPWTWFEPTISVWALKTARPLPPALLCHSHFINYWAVKLRFLAACVIYTKWMMKWKRSDRKRFPSTDGRYWVKLW